MSKTNNGQENKQLISKSNFKWILLGAFLGFVISILGNLVSAWIQNEILNNLFTPLRIISIFGASLLGVIVSAWIVSKSETGEISEEQLSNGRGSILNRSQFFWSRIKSRGRGVEINHVKSIGSNIDIDTRDKDN